VRSVAIYSVGGAPGVSTLVAAMAATSTADRPLLVVEAAPGGGVVAARWGWSTSDDSLVTAAMDTTGVVGLAGTARAWLSGSRIVVGHPSPEATMHAQVGTWVADRLADAAVPVVVDGGRLAGSSDQLRLAGAADARWVLVDPTVDQITTAAALVQSMARRTGPIGLLCLEAAGPGRYQADQAATAIGWPLVATIPHDPAAAATMCGRAPGGRGLRRSQLLRSAAALASRLHTPQEVTTDAAAI